MNIPATPEVPLPGPDIASQAAAQRVALAQSITPSGAPTLAAETVGGVVAPGIMGIIAATGALAITLVGLKTVVTGKPPWKQEKLLS